LKKNDRAGVVGFLAVMGFMFCSLGLAQADEVVAVVNGKNIYMEDVNSLMPPNVPSEQQDEFKKRVVEQLVTEKLLIEFMDKEKVKIDKKDFERKVTRIKEGLSLQLKLEKYLDGVTTDKIIKEEFEKETKNNLKASHILIKIDEETDEKAAKEKIDNVAKELKSGADFAMLAGKYSDCPSSQKGGSLGIFKQGQMVPEFTDTVLKLKAGQVSDPVKTQFGWHLIKKEEILFEDMKDNLAMKAKTRLFEELLGRLKEKATIDIK